MFSGLHGHFALGTLSKTYSKDAAFEIFFVCVVQSRNNNNNNNNNNNKKKNCGGKNNGGQTKQNKPKTKTHIHTTNKRKMTKSRNVTFDTKIENRIRTGYCFVSIHTC